MKNLATLVVMISMGSAFAQINSLKKERYECYENGELIERDFKVEKDGVPQTTYDFENDDFFSERSKDTMSSSFDSKRIEMDNRMREMQHKADEMIKSVAADMDWRMKEMKRRSEKMQLEIRKRMSESPHKVDDSKSPNNLTPLSQSKPEITYQTFGA